MYSLLQNGLYMIGNLKGCHALAPKEEVKEKCDALVIASVYTMQCTLKHNRPL
jgi:hypothetical protein